MSLTEFDNPEPLAEPALNSTHAEPFHCLTNRLAAPLARSRQATTGPPAVTMTRASSAMPLVETVPIDTHWPAPELS